MDHKETIYSKGLNALLTEARFRRKRFVCVTRVLPNAKVDLEKLKTTTVTASRFTLKLYSEHHLKEKTHWN